MVLPDSLRRPIECLMIDNFDSFTWNLYQSLTLLGAEVTVIRNDAIPASALPHLDIKRLIVSPGPGHPQRDSGISRDAIRFFAGKVPILGVCMGLECVVDVFGGEIAYAGEIKHGKLSPIRHDGRGIFNRLPQSFQSTRYHSLSASVKTVPDVLAITAVTEESGVIMGVRHRQFVIEARTWEENPAARTSDLSLPPFAIDAPDGAPVPPKSDKLPTILEKIHLQRLKDIDAAKSTPGTTPEDIETLLALNLAPPLIDFVERMRTTPRTAPALMAEIKRASPSKGPIALRANAAQQALTYALAGASVVSVLTEPHWFKGSLLDMRLARQALDALPNRPAIAEARLHGADSVLLIVALLPVARLHALYAYATRLGMEPLVEVNNAAEMDAALALGARAVGVNNRNLHNFAVDMRTTSRLAEMVRGRDLILCALSGISVPADVRAYAAQGVGAVLVGEALMRAPDTRAFIRELLGWQVPPEEEQAEEPPLVKICGIRTVDEALAAARAGADMIGLMFVPSSKRYVSLDVARRISLAIRELRAQAVVAGPSTLTETRKLEEQPPNAPWFASHAAHLAGALRAGGARPQLVGVFQDQPLAHVRDIAAAAQLDAVQLHGREPAHWAAHLPLPVVRVFHVGAGAGAAGGVAGIARPGLHQFVLLDALRADGLSGGSGTTVDWALARAVADAGEVGPGPLSPPSPVVNGDGKKDTNGSPPPPPVAGRLPIILAGGLTPESVAAAVARVRPWAVDVSGGVERTDGGGKDVDKIIAFVRAAKGLESPRPSAEEKEEEERASEGRGDRTSTSATPH
ncbi:IGPS-domain-containing protein [Phellopilus nigrolimitatus]|nr:IGPS-domain-containing protein [Phellopilus nigrolimitatus]